ncbi:class I SAM-dependent methyltransferase [Saccharomonospora piscinae]|uniref:class I SAM-dependent methyltransferase n=1 Tax=Saccharomonospora piscinae TaxID=687388 RepID=UPI0004644A17|nr:SAM-dependent methyltransferase [Saccharomonospora piscinae]
MAAAARAAHLVVDDTPSIFVDSLAARLLGDHAEEPIGYHRAHGSHPVLAGARAHAVVRSRYTEDRLARSTVTQYVILGAGLDTFAYRAELGRQVRVFEVDHPATQRWKRELAAAATLSQPGTVRFVPVDLGSHALVDRLVDAGFDTAQPALVSWLGVTMYLERDAIARTVADLGRLAPGSELIVEYLLPSRLRDEAGDAYAALVARAAGDGGEPWLSYLAPGDMSALLAEHGFGPTRHVRQRDAIGAALWRRSDSLRPMDLMVIAHAAVRPRL